MLLWKLEPRTKQLSNRMAYARISVITLTDHQSIVRPPPFSNMVISCPVASFGDLPSHTTMLSILRLMAIACIGQ